MSPLKIAKKYMASFYGEAPLEAMLPLLSEDLIFKGPFVEFNTAVDYFESLKTNLPVDVKYKILNVYEKENSVCLIYEFSKPGLVTPMAQTFEVVNGKITNIRLIFDTNAFTSSSLKL